MDGLAGASAPTGEAGGRASGDEARGRRFQAPSGVAGRWGVPGMSVVRPWMAGGGGASGLGAVSRMRLLRDLLSAFHAVAMWRDRVREAGQATA